MALTGTFDARERTRKATNAIPVKGGEVIYRGALVCIEDGEGLAMAATDTLGLKFAGISISDNLNNTAGADGDMTVLVATTGIYSLPFLEGSLLSTDNLYQTLYIYDDNTVGLLADVVNAIPIGLHYGMDSNNTTHVYVKIDIVGD